MPQTLKPHRREALVEAARDVFAEVGPRKATVAQIAARAGVATGNVYRYFPDRDALLGAAVPAVTGEAFLGVLEQRLRSLVATRDLARPDAAAQKDGDAFLAFLVAHRRELVVLLDPEPDAPFAALRARAHHALCAPALARLGERDPAVRLLVPILFDNTLHALVGVLRGAADEPALRRAIQGFWSYQLAGLAAFERWGNP